MKLGVNGSSQAEPGLLFLIDALGALRNLVTAMARDSDGSVLTRVVRVLMEQPEVDGCAIFLGRVGSEDSREVDTDLSVARGMEPSLIDLAARLSGWVMRTGLPRYESRLDEQRGSLVLIGIGFQGWIRGTLAVWSATPYRFQQWHRNLLELFGDVLGLYLARQAPRRSRLPGIPAPSAESPEASMEAVSRVPGSERLESVLDPATGLLARSAFEYRLDALLGEGIDRDDALQLLYVDVDRYRLIRHLVGDQTAERVVEIVAETVRGQSAAELAVGRLGGDTIGILLSTSSREAAGLAQHLIDSVDALGMSCSGQTVDISISIGLASINRHWVSAAAALRQARGACKAAKRHGGGSYQVYSEADSRSAESNSHRLMLSQLAGALKEDRLVLYAEPIFAARGEAEDGPGTPFMHEILLRMRDQGGVVLPAASFLSLAEHYGLSVKLDIWVVSETLRALSETQGSFASQGRFSINLSGLSIDNPKVLEHILGELSATGVTADRICFEITETAAISDIEAARHFIRVLKESGCRFALDDFGSGRASFLYLRDLDVDYLKIDGGLVRDIIDDPVSRAFVHSIDDIGKIMGKPTVAEHVETAEVLEAVRAIGIDFVQGYHSGRPVPLSELLA